jgi:hypothetical protein
MALRLCAQLGIITLVFTIVGVPIVSGMFAALVKLKSSLAVSLFVSKALPICLYAAVVSTFVEHRVRSATTRTGVTPLDLSIAGVFVTCAFLAAQIYTSRIALYTAHYPEAVIAGFLRFDFALYFLAIGAYFIGPRDSIAVWLGDVAFQLAERLIQDAHIGGLAFVVGLVVIVAMVVVAYNEVFYHLGAALSS